MIVETSGRKYYRVFPVTGATDKPDSAMAHLWHGFELKYLKKGIYHEKLTRAGKRRWTYVLKANAKIVVAEGENKWAF